LKESRDERTKAQALLDQVSNREAEVGNREERAAAKTVELAKREEAIKLQERQLAERFAALSKSENDLIAGRADLKDRLEKLKSLAA
jgi:uncharacterized protein (DUF3084 family)